LESGEYPELFVTLQRTISRLTGNLGACTTPWEMATKGLLNSGEDRRAEREDIGCGDCDESFLAEEEQNREDIGCGDCDESFLAEEEQNAISGRMRIALERARGMATDVLEGAE